MGMTRNRGTRNTGRWRAMVGSAGVNNVGVGGKKVSDEIVPGCGPSDGVVIRSLRSLPQELLKQSSSFAVAKRALFCNLQHQVRIVPMVVIRPAMFQLIPGRITPVSVYHDDCEQVVRDVRVQAEEG